MFRNVLLGIQAQKLALGNLINYRLVTVEYWAVLLE